MKGHKASYPEHDYCLKCDIDFKNEDHLLIHKIKDSKHIVCPICGIDFGSEGGRDRHIRQVGDEIPNLSSPELFSGKQANQKVLVSSYDPEPYLLRLQIYFPKRGRSDASYRRWGVFGDKPGKAAL